VLLIITAGANQWPLSRLLWRDLLTEWEVQSLHRQPADTPAARSVASLPSRASVPCLPGGGEGAVPTVHAGLTLTRSPDVPHMFKHTTSASPAPAHWFLLEGRRQHDPLELLHALLHPCCVLRAVAPVLHALLHPCCVRAPAVLFHRLFLLLCTQAGQHDPLELLYLTKAADLWWIQLLDSFNAVAAANRAPPVDPHSPAGASGCERDRPLS